MDAVGDLWEPNYQLDSLGQFASGATGDVAAQRTIVGKQTGLDHPNAIAVYSTPPGAPRAVTVSQRKHRRLEVTWRAPADNGGGLLGYRLLQKSSKRGHWSLATQTAQRSFVTGKFAKHRRVYVAVEALNEDGVSPRSAPASLVVS
jgi:Fibronectin type III domain